MTQLALDLLQPPEPSLDNFVAGRNAEALDAARRLARGALPERIVYLWGQAGCGRTHLLCSLASVPHADWWTAAAPADAVGLSLVDDVHSLDSAAQIALFSRLNAVRGDAACSCVIAGNAPPAALALREDLRTRVAWGYVYQLHLLSDAEKADALAGQAATRGVKINADVIDWLLRTLPRDMRTLAAALDALDAFALARKRALTVPLAREWLLAGRADR